MSIFRKKPVVVTREYDSWEPSAIAAEHAAEGVQAREGRSRNNAGHLKAAVDAIAAAKARDAK